MVRTSRGSASLLAYTALASSSRIPPISASPLSPLVSAFAAYRLYPSIMPQGSPSSQPMSTSVVDASGDESGASAPSHVASNLAVVRERMTSVAERCNRENGSVRLVAVSKTKPIEMLREAYEVRLVPRRSRPNLIGSLRFPCSSLRIESSSLRDSLCPRCMKFHTTFLPAIIGSGRPTQVWRKLRPGAHNEGQGDAARRGVALHRPSSIQ